VLHGLLLDPLLGIGSEAMASQSNLTYSHDLRETLARVAASQVQAAFLMNATKVPQVLDACEAGFRAAAEVRPTSSPNWPRVW